jgi:hypothetical protein
MLTTRIGMNWSELEYIVEPVVPTKGAANRVEQNQLDASQGLEVPMFNVLLDVLLE